MTVEENVIPNETTEQEVPDQTAQESGIQQVPLVIQVREATGVPEAREQLLQAIAREAQQVTDNQAGQASAALEQLARAFALVAAPAPVLKPSAAGPGAVSPQTRSSSYSPNSFKDFQITEEFTIGYPSG
jgi:hypothetical protein